MKIAPALALLLALPFAARAAALSPEDTIRALYAADASFISGKGEGVMGSTKARALYFSQAALKALVGDEKAAAKRGEPPTIEGDPFIDAQESDFADLKIVKLSGDSKTAWVEADFERPAAKVREKIDYALVFERGAWRIEDMTWIRVDPPRETLRGLLEGK